MFGLVLDFGVGKGQDAIRAIVRSCLECSGQGETAARAAAERVLSDELLDPDQLVYLNDLLDLPQPMELRALYDAMDNPARNRGKHKTVAQLLRQLSARRPQMITIEDLHWADAITLAHAAELTMLTALCPLVLVMTSRTEGDQLDPMWRSRTQCRAADYNRPRSPPGAGRARPRGRVQRCEQGVCPRLCQTIRRAPAISGAAPAESRGR